MVNPDRVSGPIQRLTLGFQSLSRNAESLVPIIREASTTLRTTLDSISQEVRTRGSSNDHW